MTQQRPSVAVIPVAGRGTRWMPISRSVPKELLPVWRRTSASYAFEEALRAGCTEVIFVISPDKHEVLDHFMQFDASDLGPAFFEIGSWRQRLIDKDYGLNATRGY